jgi:hypothetical protein
VNEEKTLKVRGIGWRNASSKSDETRPMQIERKPSISIMTNLTRSPGQPEELEAQLQPNHKSRNWKLLYLPRMKMMDTDEFDLWPKSSSTNC